MSDDFYKALASDDSQAVKSLVIEFLSKLNPSTSRSENLEKIRQWIAGHDGVASVEIEKQVLATDPPIQRFLITLKGLPREAAVKSIGVRLLPDKFVSDIK